jgi:hypothetical protein
MLLEEKTIVMSDRKPVVSWWKSGDPCLNIDKLEKKLTEINIINTRNITPEFMTFCLKHKDKLFLHINISGLNATLFEPKIPTVKEMFTKIKTLKDNGFPENRILIIINPIIPNENGLRALKLLLKLFTEYKFLRLRYVRFNVISYSNFNKEFKNNNLNERIDLQQYKASYLKFSPVFHSDYYKLISDYKGILTIDDGFKIPIIGFRELNAFGLNNEWIDGDRREKIITYFDGNIYKPNANIISSSFALRCPNKCLLCQFKG